jgi:TP901 family phage tail tape measure protein
VAVSSLVVALTARTTDFERSMKSVERNLDRTAAQVERVGARMSAGVTAPLSALAAAAAKFAVDFNDPFDKMNALMGKSKVETEALQESVLKLAGQTAQAPKALGETLYRIESAGQRGAAAMDVLRASAQGAAVGLGSMDKLADLLTAQLNAYGPSALSASQATSVMVGAVRDGRVSADALADSIGPLLPLAAHAGVPFNDLAAALTATTRRGLEASQSAAGLRTMLTTLEKPSAGAKAALAEVGLSAASLQNELRQKGLLATLDTLRAAFQGNEDALNQVFPNARTFASVLSLLGGQSAAARKSFQDLADTTNDRLGSAFRVAASDDSFKFQQAIVAVQTALIRLGQSVLPVIVPLVERFTSAVTSLTDRFNAMSAGGKDLALLILSLAASVGPVLLAFSTLYTSMATVVGLFRVILGMTGLASLFSVAATAVMELGSQMVFLVESFRSLGVIYTVVNGIIPALAGSALLAGGLLAFAAYLWITKWQELKDSMGVIVDFIKQKLDELNGATKGFMGAMFEQMFPSLSLLIQLRPAIQSALGSAADAVASGAGKMKTSFLGELSDMEGGLSSVMSRMLQKAQGFASGIMGGVKGGIGVVPPTPAAGGLPGAGNVPPAGDSESSSSFRAMQAEIAAEMQKTGSTSKLMWSSFTQNAIQAAQTFKQQVHGMVSATESSMGSMTAAFAQGKTNIGQFVQGMIQAIVQLIAKILILQALTSAGLGGPFATSFVGGLNFGGGRAAGGRVSPGSWYMVGEKGPEPFFPDTAGTIIPTSAMNGGSAPTVIVQQTVAIDGLDLGSEQAAGRLAAALKEHARSGANEGVQLALALAQTAKKNSGRGV